MRSFKVLAYGSTVAAGIGLVVAVCGPIAAQVPTIHSQMRHARGQNVVPIFEGWFDDEEGRRHASYGYVNLNTEETLTIPIGPNNQISPGAVDRGQPTHFLPGHQKGVFVVTLPRAEATNEVTWTLSVRGKTMAIPSNLGSFYQIEGLVTNGGPFPGNTPPVLRFSPDGPSGQGPAGVPRPDTIEARPGVDVQLDVWITDDGLPGYFEPLVIRSLQGAQRRRQGRQLAVTWTKYRGPGDVQFGEASPELQEGRASTTARFGAPGEYMLRALATDGSGLNGCCWTNGYVRVVVE